MADYTVQLGSTTTSHEIQLNSQTINVSVQLSSPVNNVSVTLTSATKSFLNLTDTPLSYSGQSLKGVRVNSGESALEFYTTVADTDEKVKVSSNDTTAGYLNGKLVAGNNIVLTENNDAGDETFTVAVDTLTASDISDFDTEVSNNTDVAANTTHRTSDGTDHTYIDQDVTTTGDPSFASLTVDTDTLFVDKVNSRVSIGNTSPIRKLNIYDSGNDARIAFHTATTGTGATDGTLIGPTSNGDFYFWNYENQNIYFGTNGFTRMTVLNNGNVGIGTDSPDANLHIKEGPFGGVVPTSTGMTFEASGTFFVNLLTPNNKLAIINFGDPEDTDVGRIRYDHSTNKMDFYVNAGQRMAIDSSGNVGIGTNSPDTKLDVNGAITQRELSSDPADPDEGSSVVWQSDGTGTGDDGDIVMKITAGGVTKTVILVDFSTL